MRLKKAKQTGCGCLSLPSLSVDGDAGVVNGSVLAVTGADVITLFALVAKASSVEALRKKTVGTMNSDDQAGI